MKTLNFLPNIKDKRGRAWESFLDQGYFDLICVRPVGERKFDSQLSFHFSSKEDALSFMKLLEKAA